MLNYRVTISVSYEIQCEDHESALLDGEHLAESIYEIFDFNKKSIKVEPVKAKGRRKYVTLGEFDPDEILPFVRKDDHKEDYIINGEVHSVRMNSQRYFVFRENQNCVACGLKGTKMILERNPSDRSPHFNLYGEEDGELVMMTKDHVIPKSLGGQDRHSNYQTMCSICNGLKGSSNLTIDSVGKLRKIYNDNKLLTKKNLRDLLEKARVELELPPCVGNDKNICNGSFIVVNDINIWLKDDKLFSTGAYDPQPLALHFACLKKGSFLNIVSFESGQVIAKLCDGQIFGLPPSFVKVLGGENEL